ncbi:MAG: hypothetical protein IJI22_01920 [Bacilli bacterium]|nr:hypothetical protein [Bacilli bacterium]
MEDIVYYNDLYDLYGELLTDKQREYFKDYYFDNLSYSEMASKYEVSRNAVFKQLHIVLEKLNEYEKKLQLYKKREKLSNIIVKIEDEKIKKMLENLI